MTSISTNVYIDKLDDIVNKHNKALHSTIKMKPTDVKSSRFIDYSEEINDFIILKLVILLQYQNIKTFLQKAMFQICLKNLRLKK